MCTRFCFVLGWLRAFFLVIMLINFQFDYFLKLKQTWRIIEKKRHWQFDLIRNESCVCSPKNESGKKTFCYLVKVRSSCESNLCQTNDIWSREQTKHTSFISRLVRSFPFRLFVFPLLFVIYLTRIHPPPCKKLASNETCASKTKQFIEGLYRFAIPAIHLP